MLSSGKRGATGISLTIPMKLTNASTWVLHDGRAGHRRQALALVEALGLDHVEWSLTASGFARWHAPYLLPGSERAFGTEFGQALQDERPSLVIGCGRLAALASRCARQLGARAVQILDPRLSSRHWDWLVIPEHDRHRGDNIITSFGSLHPVDQPWLARARAAHPVLLALPSPRNLVLLGGPSPAVRFDRGAFEVLASKLEYLLAREGGSLMLSGSRRTPPELVAQARERWREVPGLRWFDAGDGDNPYAGMLAAAERIIVSPDSVNMISEACATAVPVYVAEPARASGRVGRYLDDLRKRGRIREQQRLLAPFDARPLIDTPRVAALLREKLGLWNEQD